MIPFVNDQIMEMQDLRIAYGVVIPESVGVIQQTFNTLFNKYKHNDIFKKKTPKKQLLFMNKLPLEFVLLNKYLKKKLLDYFF